MSKVITWPKNIKWASSNDSMSNKLRWALSMTKYYQQYYHISKYTIEEETIEDGLYGIDIEDTAIHSEFYVDTQTELMHIANGMPYSERRK